MKKWFKRGLFTLVVFVIVALVGAAVFLLTFDPNAYKNKVAELVYEKYQRQLEINGDIELSLFPRIGLSVEKVTLSDRNSDTLFASLDSARFAVAVWPLLWNRLVVDHVAVNGAQVWLNRDENQNFNFTDLIQRSQATPTQAQADFSLIKEVQAQSTLLAPDANQAEFQIDIAGLSLKDSALYFYDQSSGTQQQLVGLELNTGRMTFGQPFDVIFKGQLQGDKPISSAQVEGQAVFQIEPHLHRYAAQRINLNVTGNIGPYKAQSASLRGGLEWLVHTQDIRARQIELLTQGQWQLDNLNVEKVNWSLTASQLNLKHNLSMLNAQKMQWRLNAQLPKIDGAEEQKVEVALDVPRLVIETDNVESDPIAFSLKQTQGAHMFGLNARLKNMGGTAKNIALNQLQLDVAHKKNNQAWKWSTTTDANWQPQTKWLDWQNMITHVHLEDEAIKPNPAQAKLEGKGSLDGDKARIHFEGNWSSANTNADIQIEAEHKNDWLLNVAIDAERIDLSPWLVAESQRSDRAKARLARKTAPTRLLIDQLDWRELQAKVLIKTKRLVFNQFQMEDLNAEIAQKDAIVSFDKWTARSFDGQLVGSGQWHHNTGQTKLQAKWKEADLYAYSQAFSTPLQWAGKGAVSVDLSTTGWTELARHANLAGKTQIQAQEAYLVGWGFWPYMQELNQAVRNIFSGQVKAPNGRFTRTQNTALQRLDYVVTWNAGQGQITKWSATAPGLRLQLEPHSYFDAVNQQLQVNFRIDMQRKSIPAAFADLSGYATHPLYLTAQGTWASPNYSIDWARQKQPEIQQALEAGLLSVLTGHDVSEALSPPMSNPAKAAEEAAKGLGSTLIDLLKK